jgi:hypothetical protein
LQGELPKLSPNLTTIGQGFYKLTQIINATINLKRKKWLINDLF